MNMTDLPPTGERVRVLHIITRLAARGAPRHVLDLAQRLDGEGFDVSILTGTPEVDEGNLLTEARTRGLQVEVVDEMRRAVRPIQDLIALYKIFRMIRRGCFDIVHTHISKAGILGRVAAWVARTPVVMHTYHGPVEELSNPVLLAVERWVAKRTDVLIAVSPSVVEHQLALGLGCREQYEVVPNGIDLQWYQEATGATVDLRASLGGEPILGTIGSLTAEKGTEVLISAAAVLCRSFPELRVCIVGDGSARDALAAQVEALGLSNHVVFVGNVEDVRGWLSVFDVFALPSYREGMSRSLLEAMAAGCAAVATNVGDAPEMLDASCLVAAGDIDGLVEAITRLLNDDDERHRQHEHNQTVAGRHDLQIMTTRMAQLYASHLKKPA
jgi:glycosyltransferase involved in cell wall biosynthesis